MNLGQKKEIGEKIRYERKYRNLTLEECSKILGVTASFLGLVERGERNLSLDKMLKFCSVFGLSTDYVLYNESILKEEYASIKEDIVFELQGLTEKDYNILLAIIRSYKISSEENFPYKMRTKRD